MTKEEVLTAVNEQYRVFLTNFHTSLPEGKEENIHQFRVAVKKMRAIQAYLIVGCSQEAVISFKELFSIIRPVYKSSGKVRNLQVILRALSDSFQYFPPSKFTERLMEKLHDGKNNYRSVSNEIELMNNEMFSLQFSKLMEEYFKKNSDDFLAHITANRVRALDNIKENKPGKKWHDARRWLKQNYLLLHRDDSPTQQPYSQKEWLYYRNLEQLLGQWHDLLMLKKQVKKFDKANSDIKASEWKLFKNELDERLNNFENLILSSL